MDQDDKCLTYGHTGGIRISLEYSYTTIAGAIVRSKRRKRVKIFNCCGTRAE